MVAIAQVAEDSGTPHLRRARGWRLVLLAVVVAFPSCSAPPKTFATLDAAIPAASSAIVFEGPSAPAEDDPLVKELAELRLRVQQQLELPTSDRSVHVHVFADEASYQAFARESFPELADRRALFVEAGGTLNVFTRWGEETAIDLRHEVTHGCLHASLEGLPLWLDEGLAEYYEVPAAAGGWNEGHIIGLAARHAAGDWRPQLERLEALERPGDMVQVDYAEAWAWTYWMLHGPSEARQVLREYLREARTGTPAIPLSARLAVRLERNPAPEIAELVRSGQAGIVE